MTEHTFHTHGHAAAQEGSSFQAMPKSLGTYIQPAPGATMELSGWFHFSIPAPSVLNGISLQVERVWVHFAAGLKAKIDRLELWESDSRIWDLRDLNWTGRSAHWEIPYLSTPQHFSRGLGLSLHVVIEGAADGNLVERCVFLHSVAVTVRS
jgi:hypothetical protein